MTWFSSSRGSDSLIQDEVMKKQIGLIQRTKEVQDSNTKLRRSEYEIRRLFEGAAVGNCGLDTSGSIEYVNSRFGEIIGWNQGDLSGKSFFDLLGNDVESLSLFQSLARDERDSFVLEHSLFDETV